MARSVRSGITVVLQFSLSECTVEFGANQMLQDRASVGCSSEVLLAVYRLCEHIANDRA